MQNFDPKKIAVTVAGQLIHGFAKGTFVKIGRDEDGFSLMVGADGESTRAKNANKAGKFTFTLLATSASNDYLTSLHLADELSGQSTFAVMVKDNRGTSLYAAATAWVVKPADAEWGVEAAQREWVIQTDELLPFAGGSTT